MTQNDLTGPQPGSNYFLVTWCDYGLESIVDVGDMWYQEHETEKINVWNILSGAEKQPSPLRNGLASLVRNIKLRGRLNNHRHYHSYVIMTDGDIGQTDIQSLFDSDLKAAASTVSKLGLEL